MDKFRFALADLRDAQEGRKTNLSGLRHRTDQHRQLRLPRDIRRVVVGRSEIPIQPIEAQRQGKRRQEMAHGI